MPIKTDTKKIIKPFLLTVFLVLLGFSLTPGAVMGANFPLKITNIKPAGTGDPIAMPATHRIYRAYPGIEYNIRVAAVGGVYPYTYSLSNEPTGMSINSSTGEITWPDPQSDSGTITVSVTDAGNTTVTADWSVTVSTSGFWFVDATASTNGTGSMGSPFNSLKNLLNGTLNESGSDIVYFRAGSYDLIQHNDSMDYTCNLGNNPRSWIGYPGETVTINGIDTTEGATRIFFPDASYIWFDSLEIKSMIDYALFLAGDSHYYTVRRSVFDGLLPSEGSGNNNQGFIHTSKRIDNYYSVIQDNEFTNWESAAALGSFYYDQYLLIEDNYIHSPKAEHVYDGLGANLAFAVKSLMDYLTIRGNEVHMGDAYKGSIMGTSINNWFNLEYFDVCFNYFTTSGTFSDDFSLNAQPTGKGEPNIHINFYRNTVDAYKGRYRYNPCDTEGSGPFTFKDNVFILNYNELDISSTCDKVTYAGNLEGRDSDNIINESGELTEGYSEYLGIKGYQIDGQETTTQTDDSSLGRPLNPRIAE